MKSKKDILLVDDDKLDVMTVQRALKDIHVANPLRVAFDGVEALAYLGAEGTVLPALILLDINMPRMNGLELLAILKQDERLRPIPVIVLTTSPEERGKLETFQLGAAGYMVKPVDYLQFVEMMRTIDLYWTVSETPYE